ncbi:MAG TPA: methyltransferase [Candidatus Avipropionibacterium avicola]|uniref:Methyltransferase n=1 Tax=Candidatus Avipropionibacterium avicola TaxID=2840701 RepID=A0A9D1KM54_9ACTN|nr:methyltransferase [Candidatus Avipropionibacterium avicola]
MPREQHPVTPPDGSVIERLRDRFDEVDYRVDPVTQLLGDEGHAALGRNHTVPGRRALSGDTGALATLTGLWLLQDPVPRGQLDRALPGLVEPLLQSGILTPEGDQVRAAVDIRPYGSDDGLDAWVVCDLTPGMDGRTDQVGDDYVLGVSPASTTLTQLATRTPVGTALDLGTGCGVQSLHLARHAERVVATDVNPRALRLAQWTFALNRLQVDLRHGSLYEPVGHERFDQVVSNPPYVISPPDSAHLTYREQAMPGDQLVREVVAGAVRRLNPGGTAQVLANWIHPRGGDWGERLESWVAGTDCDLHVLQREVLDPAEYVELWLADAGLNGTPQYRTASAHWLDHLAALGVEAIGMGWILLSRSGRQVAELTVEDWPGRIVQPIGLDIAAWPTRSGLAQRPLDELRRTRFAVAHDVVAETYGRPGAADPARLVLQQTQGLCRTHVVSSELAGIVGACDGELALGAIIDAVAQIVDADAHQLTEQVVPELRTLVRHGLLTAAPTPAAAGTRTIGATGAAG